MTYVRRSFLGLDIHGDINPGVHRRAQRTQEEFAVIVQAVLDDPTVTEFGWHQYTPYFNDGEPCIFGANGAWTRLIADPEIEEDDLYEGKFDIGYGADERIGFRSVLSWEGVWPDRQAIYGPYTGPDEARYDRLRALRSAIEGGAFDDVLLSLFGDHCEVTVRRDGIQVDEYSHD